MNPIHWIMVNCICQSTLFANIYAHCTLELRTRLESTLQFFLLRAHQNVDVEILLVYAGVLLNRLNETPFGTRFDFWLHNGCSSFDSIMSTACIVFGIMCDNVMLFLDDDHNCYSHSHMSLMLLDSAEYSSNEEKRQARAAYRHMKICVYKDMDYLLYVDPMIVQNIFTECTAYCAAIRRPVAMVRELNDREGFAYPIAKR